MATTDALNKRRVDAIDLVRWAPVADLQMFEEMPQPGCLESGVIISNVFAFRWAMAAGTRAGTLLYKSTSERAADLSEAEVAAGGGGAFIQAALYAPESRRRWKQFFANHADLWDQGSSWAKVALLYWNDQVFYEYPEHNAIAHRLVHVLSESQVPFDMVTEQGLDRITAYPVVLAPMLRYVDEAQLETILDYVRQGGNLVLIEPFATEDRYARLRSANPPAAGDIQTGVYGAGKILRLHSDEVPARQSDLWCLMEERANAYLLARDYLNRTRAADHAAGIDLGPQFVRRLEQTFQLRLRWCSEQTDPALYIHAYQLPANEPRPQRIVVHAVNYHLPILVENGRGEDGEEAWSGVTQSGDPVVCKNLQITVPLPAGWRAKHVQALSPTDPLAPVTWRSEQGQVTLHVDQVAIYQALCIDLEKE
ncbi:MAG: hypothetical protein A2W31_16750 [Planctomycetes bacterium RBG_16_64_10]|nr:MAG: hypothetical protein A2W31_16750 [Planctomycetes bacterium RBG_16_64_10]